MSDAVLERLILAVENLTIATDRLSGLLAQQSPPVPASEPASSTHSAGVIVLEELSRVPFPQHFSSEVLRVRYRDISEGPGPIPSFVTDFCKERLSGKAPGIQERTRAAYHAGFWARVAIDTVTPYQPREIHSKLVKRHWIVLRSSFPDPFRTQSKKDVQNIVSLADPNLVCEAFESLAEVEVFCLAARSNIPVLQSCSSNI